MVFNAPVRLLLITYCLLSAQAVRVGAEEPVPVAVVNPGVATVADELRLSGSLRAEHQASLSPRVDGLVAEVLVDAGSQVKQGDVLLRLDDDIARLAQDEARAARVEAEVAMTEAQRVLDEARRLRQQNHISESETAARRSDLALARAAYEVALARERTAMEQVQRHLLPAPMTGVITVRNTEAGEWVSRGDPVLELVAIEPVRLDVMAPQERFPEISSATPVEVLPDAMPGARLKGRIAARVPVGDASARAFLVRVVIDNPQVTLLPGTSATAVFRLNHSDLKRLVVPRDALLRQPDGGYSLFVVSEGRAERRPVQVGREGPEGIVIQEGLEAGEPVVIRGNEILRSGQSVRVVDGR